MIHEFHICEAFGSDIVEIVVGFFLKPEVFKSFLTCSGCVLVMGSKTVGGALERVQICS